MYSLVLACTHTCTQSTLSAYSYVFDRFLNVLRFNSKGAHQTFVPLVYMFSLEIESLAACNMLVQAANKVSLKYFGKKLDPGAVASDHCDGFKYAYSKTFDGFMQCWPHIIRKWMQNEYKTKDWSKFEDVTSDIQALHLAHSDEMKDLLIEVIGKVRNQYTQVHASTCASTRFVLLDTHKTVLSAVLLSGLGLISRG